MIILAIIPIVFLFSCASAPAVSNVNNDASWPEWLANHPQAPSNANYNYIVRDGIGRTEEEAMKNALEKAHKEAASIIGRPLAETYGIRYGIRCYHHVEKNIYNHTVYILFKHQIRSMASGAQDDYNNPDGIKCKSAPIENAGKNTEEAATIGEKQGHLSYAIASLNSVVKKFESAGNVKQKNEVMNEGKKLYEEINKLQGELRVLNTVIGLDSTMETVRDIYSKMRASCIEYGKSAGLHWNSEQNSEYSNLAFSKLSGSLDVQKSDCANNGVSLVYKDSKPVCKRQYGVFACSYGSDLSIASCEGNEYLLLQGENVEGVKAKEDDALDNLKEKLARVDFWKEWELELNKWRLKCD
ncbi:MAG: hypothetical protein LBB36_03680 [Fibromonadaceae bacterium]|jgi:hypothetical protein|nr:hypothetical protein [Fibromonadaceae bacterium]